MVQGSRQGQSFHIWPASPPALSGTSLLQLPPSSPSLWNSSFPSGHSHQCGQKLSLSPTPSAAAASFTLVYSEQNSKMSQQGCFHFSWLQSGSCPCHSHQGCKLPPVAKSFGVSLSSAAHLSGLLYHRPALAHSPSSQPFLFFSGLYFSNWGLLLPASELGWFLFSSLGWLFLTLLAHQHHLERFLHVVMLGPQTRGIRLSRWHFCALSSIDLHIILKRPNCYCVYVC